MIPISTPISPKNSLSPLAAGGECGARKRSLPLSSDDASSLDTATATPAAASKIPPPTTPHATTFLSTPERKGSKSSSSGAGGPTISRSIQACNRCRARKTRCDQKFPSCSACIKAQVDCVGIDSATGREIPRSYVDWLEKRVKYLEDALNLEKEGARDGGSFIDPQLQPGWETTSDAKSVASRRSASTVSRVPEPERIPGDNVNGGGKKAPHMRPDIENLVNQVGLVGVQGSSAQGFMGGTSGISCVNDPPLKNSLLSCRL